jgi:2-dehydro-3-deoxygalactonokinase
MTAADAPAPSDATADYPAARFIAGDWGSTSLRLSLCASGGRILARASGRGIGVVAGEFEAEIERLLAPWSSTPPDLPLLLCGAVGSNIGWREAPYAACPANADGIAARVMRFQCGERPVCIMPGLSCRNRLDAPDFMRGEETQIVGALHLRPPLATGRHLLGLPGTHSKWAVVDQGLVTAFSTTLAGELYAALADHSVLLHGVGRSVSTDMPSFRHGLDRVAQRGAEQLLQLLFETRARQLQGGLAGAQAASFLSGLIIGADIAIASHRLRADAGIDRTITLIGTPDLTALYAQGFAMRDISITTLDGGEAALAGLCRLLPELIS